MARAPARRNVWQHFSACNYLRSGFRRGTDGPPSRRRKSAPHRCWSDWRQPRSAQNAGPGRRLPALPQAPGPGLFLQPEGRILWRGPPGRYRGRARQPSPRLPWVSARRQTSMTTRLRTAPPATILPKSLFEKAIFQPCPIMIQRNPMALQARASIAASRQRGPNRGTPP